MAGTRSAGAGGTTTPARLTARERQLKAVELRKAGSSYPEIAAALGYANKASAYKAVVSVLARMDQESGAEVLNLELARLDTMQRVLAPKVLAGSTEAIHASLRIMDRRAKYLGLDHSEAKTAAAVEAMAVAYTAQVGWLQTAMVAILERLELTPEQQAAAPVIIAGYLEENAADVA